MTMADMNALTSHFPDGFSYLQVLPISTSERKFNPFVFTVIFD
jgi:hypothetical protein